ncbi:hypothetical protein H1230_06985 [Paenibacillus sp. 19GGS1-52]|uniref:hypothetical protein n=1 Tax=Paenibacillus sp. 19GGS1-52 TaxID=2758563 RepID=UPI001EFAC31F|nr:hypothetical protein [Paenibacillus sp. 19GGS1-52]ULO08544.1 hypothetical protein H1230_06985 [Paenibacillus sp. 19GGS1-52]
MNILFLLSAPMHTILYLFIIIVCIRSIFRIDLLRWTNPRISARVQIISVFIGRVLCLTATGIFIWISIPYWKDDFLLITKKYIVTESYPLAKYNESKDLNEYVVFNTRTLTFLFDSEMDIGKKYEIKYLPNTNIGIYRREIK